MYFNITVFCPGTLLSENKWVLYRLNVRSIVVRFPAEAIDFYPLQGQQVGSEADPASCWVGTGAAYRGINRSGRDVDHSPQSSPELKNEWSCGSAAAYAIMMWRGAAFMFCAQEVTASFCFLISFNHLYFYIPNDCKLFHFSFVAVIRSVWQRVVNAGFVRHASGRVPWRK
jgi:hypothetical protein